MALTGFIGDSLGYALFAVLALLALGLTIYLMGEGIRRARERNRKQDHRDRQRREFWGYE